MATSSDDWVQSLLDRHDRLELDHADGDAGRFLSGWQCVNPWSAELTAKIDAERRGISGESYQYIEHDSLILGTLRAFHEKADGFFNQEILPGFSSTSLLFAYCAHLHAMKVTEIYYIPPLYFTFHSALRLFGIRARPVSARHPYEAGFTINLPERTTVLMLSDPTWYSGTSVDAEILHEIADWQVRTESQVLVDGSFQYMRWNNGEAEPSSKLDPNLTTRVICPTKQLALHSYRFAYLVGPKAICRAAASYVSITSGSSSGDSLAFGRVAVREMLQGAVQRDLVKEIKQRHSDLRARDRIRSDWMPTCGYFVFEQPTFPISSQIPLMDGSFFEQKRFPDCRRINLLSPSIALLG